MKKLFSIFLILTLFTSILFIAGCNGDDDDDDNNNDDDSRVLVYEGILGIFSTGSGDVLLHYITPDSYELSTISDEEPKSAAFDYEHSQVCYATRFELYLGDPETGIFEMVSDGDYEKEERFPAFLRNGRIAYILKHGYDYNNICTFDPNISDASLDTLYTAERSTRITQLKASLTGNYLSFIEANYLYCIDLETGDVFNPNFAGIESYDWATGGDYMVQYSDYELYWVDVAADSATEILSTTGSNRINDAAFSPDDSKVAYVIKQSSTESKLYLMNADGTGEAELLIDTASDGESIRHIAFSPDGSKIVYYASPMATGAIYVVDIATKEVETIVDYCENASELIWN
ncbi:MAG: hypothetical protein ACLFSQ_01825 [Candidatus Zixiibacteriota bacterium]